MLCVSVKYRPHEALWGQLGSSTPPSDSSTNQLLQSRTGGPTLSGVSQSWDWKSDDQWNDQQPSHTSWSSRESFESQQASVSAQKPVLPDSFESVGKFLDKQAIGKVNHQLYRMIQPTDWSRKCSCLGVVAWTSFRAFFPTTESSQLILDTKFLSLGAKSLILGPKC